MESIEEVKIFPMKITRQTPSEISTASGIHKPP